MDINKTNNIIALPMRRKIKHSPAFKLLLFIIIMYPILFYLRIDEGYGVLGYFIPVICMIIIDIYMGYKLLSDHSRLSKRIKAMLFLFFFLGIVTYCVNSSGLDRFLNISALLMSISFFQLYPLRKQERKAAYIVLLIALLIILSANIAGGNINTNTSGFFLAILFCVSLVRYLYAKDLLSFFCIVLSFALQFVFVSRTATFGCLAFVLLLLIFKAQKKSFSRRKLFTIILLLSILGIVFAWFYSEVLYANLGRGNVFIFGKDLFTGREGIWHYTFESIRENFWFGAGSQINANLINTGFSNVYSNVHNQPLGILAGFGILIYSTFYIILASSLCEAYKKRNLCSRIPAIFMIVIIAMSYLETYFFVQSLVFIIIIGYSLIFNYGKRLA